MIGKNKSAPGSGQPYREEPVKPAIYTMLVIVGIVALPLGWLNQKISAEGSKVADTSRYQELVKTVTQDVVSVQRMLDSETVGQKVLKGTAGPQVSFFRPDVPRTNEDDIVMQDSAKFKIELSGIYWGKNPIATINGDNYHTGETVMGHRIIEIRKTEVVFEDPMGQKAVKYLYDFLDEPHRRK